jgi:hypothetical protein
VVPPAGAVTNPPSLALTLIDPAVISVDWTVDGAVRRNGGSSFDVASSVCPT